MSGSILHAFTVGATLLAGYLFIRFSPYRRYTAERLRADRFALHLVGFSVVFYMAGVILHHFLSPHLPDWEVLAKLEEAGIPIWVFYAYAVSLVATQLDKIVTLILMSDDTALRTTEDRTINGRSRLAAIALYVRRSNDATVRTIYRATYLRKQIMVTLKSGKVYVGGLARDFDPSEVAGSLRIVPIASGYRHKDTKKVHLSTEYSRLDQRRSDPSRQNEGPEIHPDDALKSDPHLLRITDSCEAPIDLEDLGVVMPWSEVESVTIFDPSIYLAFQDVPQPLTDDLAHEESEPSRPNEAIEGQSPVIV